MPTSAFIDGNSRLNPESENALFNLLQEMRGQNIRAASFDFDVTQGGSSLAEIVVVNFDGTEHNLMAATSAVAEPVRERQIDLLDKFRDCLLENAIADYSDGDGCYGTVSIDVEHGVAGLQVNSRREISVPIDTIKSQLSEVYSSPHPYYPQTDYADVEKLLDVLAGYGVTKIDVEYQGGGDEGHDEDVTLTIGDADGDSRTCRLEETHISGVDLSRLVGSLLAKNHFGYENGVGGGGHICIDVKNRSLMHEGWDFHIASSGVALRLRFGPLEPEDKGRAYTPRLRG